MFYFRDKQMLVAHQGGKLFGPQERKDEHSEFSVSQSEMLILLKWP